MKRAANLVLLPHPSDGHEDSRRQVSPKLVENLIPNLSGRVRTADLGGEQGNSLGNRERPFEGGHEEETSMREPRLSKQLKRSASNFDLWDERLLLDIIPIVLGQSPCNQNGSHERYREFLLNDKSNDEIMHSSLEDIITRSGFEYERHESISDDGYSTKLIRLKNPLMQGRALKQPPVVLLQTGAISATVFVAASSAQHHPQLPSEPVKSVFARWRPALDLDDRENPVLKLASSSASITRPIAHEQQARAKRRTHRGSSSRSLAFMLANQGYDVWIAESRGHRSKMTRRRPLDNIVNSLGKTSKSVASLLSGNNRHKNMTLGESVVQLSRAPHYWTYSFDEIVRHQVKNQIETVLKVSGAENVTLVSYSFSSMVTLPFLASRPRFVRERLHNLVLMGPILSNRGANTLFNYLYRHPCLSLPDDLIGFLGTEDILTKPLRRLFTKLGCHSPTVRYKVLKFLFYLFQGPSAQYRTFLEPALFGHFFEPTSLLQVKHFCQQVLARKYQRYNFGPLKNVLVYGQEKPPVYNMSQIKLRPGGWLLVSAENDNLGTKDSVEQLLEEINVRPQGHIEVAGYAHLDLVAGVDNDLQVNAPILDYLERNHYYLD